MLIWNEKTGKLEEPPAVKPSPASPKKKAEPKEYLMGTGEVVSGTKKNR